MSALHRRHRRHKSYASRSLVHFGVSMKKSMCIQFGLFVRGKITKKPPDECMIYRKSLNNCSELKFHSRIVSNFFFFSSSHSWLIYLVNYCIWLEKSVQFLAFYNCRLKIACKNWLSSPNLGARKEKKRFRPIWWWSRILCQNNKSTNIFHFTFHNKLSFDIIYWLLIVFSS